MRRTVLLSTLLMTVSACVLNEGRQTNCWSGGAIAFAAGTAPSACSEWVDVGG